jgi:excisionase family DNA binding protein
VTARASLHPPPHDQLFSQQQVETFTPEREPAGTGRALIERHRQAMPTPRHVELDGPFEPRIGRSVSIDEAARLLGVTRRTIYARIRSGRLQTVRTLGASRRVVLESLNAQKPLSNPDGRSTADPGVPK